MVVARGVKVRHAVDVLDGREETSSLFGSNLASRRGGSLDGGWSIFGDGRGPATVAVSVCGEFGGRGTDLDVPEGVPLGCPFAPKVSSLNCGRRKSIFVGLRARGSWTREWPFCGLASMEEDSAIMGGMSMQACWSRGTVRCIFEVSSQVWCQPRRRC